MTNEPDKIREIPGGSITIEPWEAYLWADATSSESDVFRSDETAREHGEGGQLAPPSLGFHVAVEATGGIQDNLDAADVDWEAGALLGQQRYEFHQPIHVGEEYDVSAELTDIERKRGSSGTFDVATFIYHVQDSDADPVFEMEVDQLLMKP